MNDICMTVTMTFTEEDINCFLHYGGTDVKSLKPGALEKLAAIIGNRTFNGCYYSRDRLLNDQTSNLRP